MRDVLLFLLFLPLAVAFMAAGAVAVVALFVAAVPYILGKLVWASVTGRELGPGW